MFFAIGIRIYILKGYFDFMNNFLNKLERKFGRYAIPDLIRYVIVLYCAGAVIGMINPRIYYNYLCLDMSAVFRGQIWRLFTFLIEPYGFSSGMGMLLSILFFVIQVQLFFLFGRSLEQAWGTFRFNMYFLSGYLFNIIAALILYISPLHSAIYYSVFPSPGRLWSISMSIQRRRHAPCLPRTTMS